MKKTVLALGIAGTLTLSGLSQAGTLSNTDKDFLFGSQSVQAKIISVEEMKDTNGEFWGALAISVVFSVVSYVADRWFNQHKKPTVGGIAFSVIAGTPGGKIGWVGRQLIKYKGKYKTYINLIGRGHKYGAGAYGTYVGNQNPY